ncbi:dienelactone hydrolase family protein [Lutibacter aestuarii]|uniref:Dienelactone hydrolase family protein n=1 Tax=Lutibacter aestuarii TaxID=861111 RepID=A0ABW2Z339_9FLAO
METISPYKVVEIKLDNIILNANLRMTNPSKGIILFSHGSGSSRLSIRNNYVASLLFKQGYSSLLFDLLMPEEDLVYGNRFDINLLTERLVLVTHWVSNYKETSNLPIGYFGSSTGAASALSAASKIGKKVKAIVSRGGRPDLAIIELKSITIPTLLIVGGNDGVVIELNKKAKEQINGVCELEIIEGASHLFVESGKLDLVAQKTISWFNTYIKNK